ncbi:MAG: L,D-transpeptidase family protein [Gammaproteobacteria bacterium]|nr:L,D-transpeptidase family protein [Gammaproteobacteria bacterium]
MTRIRKVFIRALVIILFFNAPSIFALNFALPSSSNDVVGTITTGIVQPGDNFASIARRYDVGYCEVEEANPGVNPDEPPVGSVLIIPSQYVLPDVPKAGLVINLVEMRLYFFPTNKREVHVFPVGIGREGWESPLGVWTIIERTPLPTWHAPESIREARAKEGVFIPKEVPPGPENPLGDYAMRLSNHTYLIHGTNDPSGVGRRSSAGCIRMYPEDIKKLFEMTHNGSPVRIINYPYKAGWKDSKLYLETHLPLNGVLAALDPDHKDAEQVIKKAITRRGAAYVNWSKAQAVAKEQQAIPQEVGRSTDKRDE